MHAERISLTGFEVHLCSSNSCQSIGVNINLTPHESCFPANPSKPQAFQLHLFILTFVVDGLKAPTHRPIITTPSHRSCYHTLFSQLYIHLYGYVHRIIMLRYLHSLFYCIF